MHGSFSVPKDLRAEIREFGGDMKETYGVPVEEIQEAIKFGVRKVNIDTDIRLAMTGAIRRFMAENPGKLDPREYLKQAREAAKKICKQRYEQLGTAGNRSEEHKSELQSIMRNSYVVFCLKTKQTHAIYISSSKELLTTTRSDTNT